MLARQPGVLLGCRCDPIPDGVLALDPESVLGAKAALKQLSQPQLQTVRGGLCLEGQGGRTILRLLPARDVPPPPDLRSVTWHRVTKEAAELMVRVASVAALEREDRQGLTWVRLGPGWSEATDEVVVARAPGLAFEALMPAAAFLLTKGRGALEIGELGLGAVVVRAGEVTICGDSNATGSTWFPALEPCWADLPLETGSVVVSRLALQAAIRAAAKSETVVHLGLSPEGSFGVWTPEVLMRLEGQCSGKGGLLVDSRALLLTLVGAAKEVKLVFRNAGQRQPLEVRDGQFRALVWPVIGGLDGPE